MLLRATDIVKSYPGAGKGGAKRAVDGVSICIDEAECVGLIGESGSGKTTLGNIIIGLESASEGRIEFCGGDCGAVLPAHKRTKEQRGALLSMQMVFQNPQSTFSDRMKIGAGIAEGVVYHPGVGRAKAHELALEALDAVGLPREFADKHAWELSGGQCQRAAIARAIVSRPKLLICDEPTSALDVTVQAQIIDLLVSLCHERSMACLFISHDLVLVRGFCSRTYVMRSGVIVEEGPTAQLFENPQHDYTKSLLSAIVTV